MQYFGLIDDNITNSDGNQPVESSNLYCEIRMLVNNNLRYCWKAPNRLISFDFIFLPTRHKNAKFQASKNKHRQLEGGNKESLGFRGNLIFRHRA